VPQLASNNHYHKYPYPFGFKLEAAIFADRCFGYIKSYLSIMRTSLFNTKIVHKMLIYVLFLAEYL
jgi:hypothetical protein